MHLVRIDTRPDARSHAVTHRLAGSLSAHAVLVVHHIEDHRQSALHAILPKLGELVHGCEGDPFPNRTTGHGGIPNVGHYDTLFAVYFFVECGTNRDVAATSHDRVVGIDAERGKEGMHASAQSLVETGFAGKNFGQCAIYQEFTPKFLHCSLEILLNDFQNGSIEEALHDVHQLCIVQFLNGAQPLGKDLSMAAV